MAKTLTQKQREFAEAYVRCGNATEAYKAVYKCTYKAANSGSARLLVNASLRAYIDEINEQAKDAAIMTKKEVLQELSRLAKSNVGDLLTFNKYTVTLKDSGSIPKDKLGLIEDIHETKDGVKVKMHNKLKALDALAKHHGILNDGQKDEGSDSKDRETFMDTILSTVEKLGRK